MPTISHSVDVLVPVRVAYDHWTRFELFPGFMRHVLGVRRLDERRMHWQVALGGQVREFEAQLVEQTPDQRIAWESTRGALHSGAVTFHRLGDRISRITVRLDYAAHGWVEMLGSVLGVPARCVRRDLERFAGHVQADPTDVEGWRNVIPAEQVGAPAAVVVQRSFAE